MKLNTRLVAAMAFDQFAKLPPEVQAAQTQRFLEQFSKNLGLHDDKIVIAKEIPGKKK